MSAEAVVDAESEIPEDEDAPAPAKKTFSGKRIVLFIVFFAQVAQHADVLHEGQGRLRVAAAGLDLGQVLHEHQVFALVGGGGRVRDVVGDHVHLPLQDGLQG